MAANKPRSYSNYPKPFRLSNARRALLHKARVYAALVESHRQNARNDELISDAEIDLEEAAIRFAEACEAL
jgi:hypothetical protein